MNQKKFDDYSERSGWPSARFDRLLLTLIATIFMPSRNTAPEDPIKRARTNRGELAQEPASIRKYRPVARAKRAKAISHLVGGRSFASCFSGGWGVSCGTLFIW